MIYEKLVKIQWIQLLKREYFLIVLAYCNSKLNTVYLWILVKKKTFKHVRLSSRIVIFHLYNW